MTSKPLWRELLVGSLWSVTAALLCNIILIVVGIQVLASLQGGWGRDVTLEGIAFLLGYVFLPGVAICFGCSFIPAVLGGVALTGVVRYLANRVERIALASTLVGMLIGAIAAGVSVWLGLHTVLWASPDEPWPYFTHFVILACTLAAVAGGLVGRKLGPKYQR